MRGALILTTILLISLAQAAVSSTTGTEFYIYDSDSATKPETNTAIINNNNDDLKFWIVPLVVAILVILAGIALKKQNKAIKDKRQKKRKRPKRSKKK